MKARIQLSEDLLIADLENGARLQHADAIQLANLLWANQVTSSEVSMVDWHESSDRAPLSGQRIAIYQRLRLYEQSEEGK